jgi:hypothetical protein
MMPISASQSFAADSVSVSSTAWRFLLKIENLQGLVNFSQYRSSHVVFSCVVERIPAPPPWDSAP